jgi:large subunit ribosomal protein L17
MRHRVAGRHLGRPTDHRLSLYRNLVTDLLRYERITTTEAKAKEIRPMAEKVITLGKRGDLHARRQALRFLYDGKVVKKVFDDIAPRLAGRAGGYTRITSLEMRKGDGARMATIELIDYVDAAPTPRPQRVTAAPTATRRPEATVTAPVAPAEAIDEEPDEASDEPVAAVDDVTDDGVAGDEASAAEVSAKAEAASDAEDTPAEEEGKS